MGSTAEQRRRVRTGVWHRREGRAMWVWWLVANALGWAVVAAMVGIVDLSVALSFGAVIGVAQGLVLWYHLQDRALSLFWVMISTLFGPIGLVVGMGLSLALGLTRHALYGPVLAAATGAAVGYFQGPGLRRHSRRARWWALTTAVGGAAAAAVGLTATAVIPIEAARIVLAGAVYGAATGGGLVWLLRDVGAGESSPNGKA